MTWTPKLNSITGDYYSSGSEDDELTPSHIHTKLDKEEYAVEYETSWMWGDSTEQKLNEILTIYDTNIFSNEGLMIFRATAFSIMTWLIYEDVKLKHGLHYEKYTVWGEISTLITFGLLTMCSVEKYIKNIQF